jgi:hypothetical protein
MLLSFAPDDSGVTAVEYNCCNTIKPLKEKFISQNSFYHVKKIWFWDLLAGA